MAISAEKLAVILDDSTLSEDEISVLLERAEKLAVNHYFWKPDDDPTDTELSRFYNKYEFEIYEVAKALNSDSARDGETQHTELGITRVWGKTGKEGVDDALSSIPVRSYVI